MGHFFTVPFPQLAVLGSAPAFVDPLTDNEEQCQIDEVDPGPEIGEVTEGERHSERFQDVFQVVHVVRSVPESAAWMSYPQSSVGAWSKIYTAGTVLNATARAIACHLTSQSQSRCILGQLQRLDEQGTDEDGESVQPV